jgi:hypothetical protein
MLVAVAVAMIRLMPVLAARVVVALAQFQIIMELLELPILVAAVVAHEI